MGFLRKLTIISTGGLAPIKAESFKERTAKAAEKQLRLQQQTAAAAAPKFNVTCPKCKAALVSPVGDNIECPKCGFRMRVWQTTSAPSASGTAAELERLAALHKSGGLTDEEFAAAKARVLA